MSADKYPSISSRQMAAIVYIVPAQRTWLMKGSFLLEFFLDKMKRIYDLMSILVKREQEKYF